MIFTFKAWERFCKELASARRISRPLCEITADDKTYVSLKHDVETDAPKAYKMAQIEHKYGHRSTFYIQAYLMEKSENVEIFRKMQEMGHELSYHYDVMDSNKGDIEGAIAEFEKNKKIFEDNGFALVTVCQHGNPVVERVGYTSNRDFFRNERVRALYPEISDIMVNFKDIVPTDYAYFSDAGRKFKMIYDPINNDIVNSDDKNVIYENLSEVLGALETERGNIISTHPHRYRKSALVYVISATSFTIIKSMAKLLLKIPFMKKFMSRFYYLAKKI